MKLGTKILIIISSTIILLLGLVFIFFKDDITTYFKEKEGIVINNNQYSKTTNYNYVKLTNDFFAKDYNHLLNIIYTIINSGNDEFTFYCDNEYYECYNDFDDIANDQTIISNINNFVHPFNSFQKFISSYSKGNGITISFEKTYTDEEIENINNKVDEIINNNLNSSMTNTQKIETIHDYLINNTKYIKDDNEKYDTATNLLFDNKGVCSAYTDTMSIFLSKLGLNNYKIATDSHVWNLVYINDTWLHIDVTFDDPVTNTGEQTLLKEMLFVDTNKLQSLDNESHNFDKTIYSEAN